MQVQYWVFVWNGEKFKMMQIIIQAVEWIRLAAWVKGCHNVTQNAFATTCKRTELCIIFHTDQYPLCLATICTSLSQESRQYSASTVQRNTCHPHRSQWDCSKHPWWHRQHWVPCHFTWSPPWISRHTLYRPADNVQCSYLFLVPEPYVKNKNALIKANSHVVFLCVLAFVR